MCGIAGFLDTRKNDCAEGLERCLLHMTDTLRHRGPDDWGAWVDPDAGIALGHRRLAIVDLSASGRQPMHSFCGRYAITFNGEVYNHSQLRQELRFDNIRFRGHSDTEVMLAAIGKWGLPGALSRFNGMFAFALWDKAQRTLYLVRDRLGKKPLYYGWAHGVFLFASELKALRAHPMFPGTLSREAIALYFTLNYVPAPYSVYRGFFKLPAAAWIAVKACEPQGDVRPTKYWDAAQLLRQKDATYFNGSETEATEHLHSLLRDAVKLRMTADVHVGALLSGGTDSSTVVALMQAQSSKAIRTFTIGFATANYNEAGQAGKVARHLGTDHSELYVEPQDALNVIPRLPMLYDEPFADSSQIPTAILCQLVRRHVTVALTGDGGDESFGGYNRHIWGPLIPPMFHSLPRFLRRGGAKLLTFSKPLLTAALSFSSFGGLSRLQGHVSSQSVDRLARLIQLDEAVSIYLLFVSNWADNNPVEGVPCETLASLWRCNCDGLRSLREKLMYLDTSVYLPDDLLVKIDRASMGVGLEVRAPLLDYRVVEFAWSLPSFMKIRRGRGKRLLRQILETYIPKVLAEYPKKGFSVPMVTWLRGPLREWANSILDLRSLRQEGFLNVPLIRDTWEQFLRGRGDLAAPLWGVLMFESWLQSAKSRGRYDGCAAIK